MPTGYWKSEEGVKAYADIGLAYPETVFDPLYERFLGMTKNSPHNQRAKSEVRRITRVMAEDGKEYLLYDQKDTAYDSLGGEHIFYRGDLGKYPIPIPRFELRMGPNMTQQQVVADIIRHDVGYSIPFNATNVDKIHKNANDKAQTGATKYYLEKGDHSVRDIKNFDGFKGGKFDELEKFGMTLDQYSEQQRQILEVKRISEPEVKTTSEESEESEPQEEEQPNETIEEREQQQGEEEGPAKKGKSRSSSGTKQRKD